MSSGTTINTALPVAGFTAMYWYYPITLTDYRNIFYFKNSGGTKNTEWALQTNGTAIDGGTSTLSLNTGYHVAYVNNPTTSIIAYLNGVLEVTWNGEYHQGGTWDLAQIGRWSTTADFMNGRVFDVKIYSAVLTVAEIAQEMKVIRPVRTPNLFS